MYIYMIIYIYIHAWPRFRNGLAQPIQHVATPPRSHFWRPIRRHTSGAPPPESFSLRLWLAFSWPRAQKTNEGMRLKFGI